MNIIFRMVFFIILCFTVFSQDIIVEKKYSLVDDTGKPIKNTKIQSFLIQTVVYNDGKNDEFEGYVSEEAFLENTTLPDGSLNLKFKMEDLSSDDQVRLKKIKLKEFKLFIMCEGYDDNTFFMNDDFGNIVMYRKKI